MATFIIREYGTAKNCCFCHGANLKLERDPDSLAYYVVCNDCEATGPKEDVLASKFCSTPEDAISAWERRG